MTWDKRTERKPLDIDIGYRNRNNIDQKETNEYKKNDPSKKEHNKIHRCKKIKDAHTIIFPT
jgi:hypothetical protein